MSKLFPNKAFKLGVFGGIIIYIGIYAFNYKPKNELCFDCYETTGFPFVSYESGTILHLDQILWLGLIGNYLVAILFIFVSGILCSFIWSKISSRRIELK